MSTEPTSTEAASDGAEIRPFEIDVSDEELADLRSRVDATQVARPGDGCLAGRPARDDPGSGRATGRRTTTGASSRSALRPCRTSSPRSTGWTFTSFTSVPSMRMRLPLIVTHGWPGSTIEQLKIIEPLTDPTAHGADAADAFHLVIPSLPGHGFSGKPRETGWDPIRIAKAWVVLMERLGYSRYVAQGGDWGNAVTEQMALLKPDGLLGIHTNMPATFRPRSRRGSQTGDPPARRPLRRREEGVRDPGPLLRDGHRLRRARWGIARRRSTASPTRRSGWRPGCSITTSAATSSSRAPSPEIREVCRETTSSTTSPTTG